MKFQFIKVDLYNHFFEKPEVVEADSVPEAVVKYYNDPEAPELLEIFQKQFDKNDTQENGLASNGQEGTWRISGEEDLILIMQIPE